MAAGSGTTAGLLSGRTGRSIGNVAKRKSLSDLETASMWLSWLEQGGWSFALDDDGQVVATAPVDGGPRADPTNGLAALDVEIRGVLEARQRGGDPIVGECLPAPAPAPEPAPAPRQYRTLSRLLDGPVTNVLRKPGDAGGWWTITLAGDTVHLGTGRRVATENPRLLRELWTAAVGER